MSLLSILQVITLCVGVFGTLVLAMLLAVGTYFFLLDYLAKHWKLYCVSLWVVAFNLFKRELEGERWLFHYKGKRYEIKEVP